ncbi:hypothetical protein [Microcoleus sp. CAWBG24]|nr:hypothetical protein [Microcoleus sp. CAWBG24]
MIVANWSLGMGHGAWGMGHWAWGMGRSEAEGWGMGHWLLRIKN